MIQLEGFCSYFFFQCSQEEMVSKLVEFKFLTRLLTVLGVELPPPISADSAATMETDGVTDLKLDHVLRDLVGEVDSMETSDASHRCMLSALSKCLELVWKFNVYQVLLRKNTLSGFCADHIIIVVP